MNITLDAYHLTYYTNSLIQEHEDLLEMIATKNESSAARVQWHKLMDEEIQGQKARITRLNQELEELIDESVRAAKHGQTEPN